MITRLSAIALSAVFLPCVALSGELPSLDAWDMRSLDDDYSLNALLEQDVMSLTDQPMGHLRDVLVSADGRFVAAIVEFNAGEGNEGFALARMEWSDASIAPGDDKLTVSLGSDDSSDSATFNFKGKPASELIGQRVDLAGAEDFGRVTDILVDADAEQPSAFVVEHEGREFALPVNMTRSNDGAFAYPYSVEDVKKARIDESKASER